MLILFLEGWRTQILELMLLVLQIQHLALLLLVLRIQHLQILLLLFFLISFPCPSWLDILKDSYTQDPEYQQLFDSLADSGSTPASFSLHNGVRFYKGRVFLSNNSPLKPLVLQQIHNSPFSGHFGYLKTLHRVKQDFFWKGMVKDVKSHIQCCDVCQRVKVDTSKSAGLF